MFVQVIEGEVSDREGLYRQMQRWNDEIRPGARGYLGSTGGVTPMGKGILIARFMSADAARANSDRPEQSQWWADTAKCFDGLVTFFDSEDIDLFGEAGTDRAGFVQVMKGRGVDRQRIAAMDRLFEEYMADFRPDLLGGLRVWTGPDTYVEAGYFTSEEEARIGERKDPPPELADLFIEFQDMMANVEFLDLPEPVLVTA